MLFLSHGYVDKLKKQCRSFLLSIAGRPLFFLSSIVVLMTRKRRTLPSCKTLLVIRLDNLGDYCLFRNFLQPLRETYADYEITLVCNAAYYEIVQACDAAYLDHIIPVDISRWHSYIHGFFYHLKILYQLSCKSYTTIFIPLRRRSIWADDYLARFLPASHKICAQEVHLPHDPYNMFNDPTFYTTMIDTSFAPLFEFDRNKYVFSQLLGKPLTEITYHLDLSSLPKDFSLPCPEKYGVFVLGASSPRRKWALTSWIQLAQKIDPSFKVVLCGTAGEVLEGAKIERSCPRVLNLVRKTSLLELVHVLSRASFIVSTESGVPHLAMALGLGPVFVISNGNGLGYFVPYPQHLTNTDYHVIYHPEIEALLQTPHGFGRCMEAYKDNRLDLRISHPEFAKRVAEKMFPDFVKDI
ncbi:glycosyltransferase family 9 protein [Helicobacter suis]|uniref:glycosyltransferase family 9 protein n=2 Tax=Helicobacter suis TaxID=104628 RepID=UPI0013151A55|nr:glycosyltransferase family 9 protein [Helicobacter suis]